MKYDWKKQEKHLYGKKKRPEIVTVPLQKFLTIKGEGDPNNQDFSARVGTLYPVAWKIKMGFKKFYQAHEENQSEFDYSEFAIFPLEGIWSTKNTADITDKAASFQKMNQFVKEQGLTRRSYLHREIYLNDARKTPPEKRQTILRYQVE